MIKKERRWRKALKIAHITWWTTFIIFSLSLFFLFKYAHVFCLVAGISAMLNLLLWHKYLYIEDDYLHYIREKHLTDLK